MKTAIRWIVALMQLAGIGVLLYVGEVNWSLLVPIAAIIAIWYWENAVFVIIGLNVVYIVLQVALLG